MKTTHLHVARKISQAVGILYEASFFFSKLSLRTLYYFIGNQYLFYCIAVWGSTYPTSLKRLVTLQRSVVRIVNKDAFSTHIDPIFAELKMLKVDQIVLLQVVSFVFFFPNNLLLPFFDNYSPVVRQILRNPYPNQYNSRFYTSYYIPIPRTNFKKKFSILYQGPKVYNL